VKRAHPKVPPALVEVGYYFEKGNSPGWLRYVVECNGRARYVDFTGAGECDASQPRFTLKAYLAGGLPLAASFAFRAAFLAAAVAGPT
jgi:hypothetical protein